MDSSFAGDLPDPVLNFTNATDPFIQYRASLGRIEYFVSAAKNYTIEPYIYGKKYGLVASINLVKLVNGYYIMWNV